MKRVFKKICKAYNLGELREYTKLEGGTAADAWKLTANGYFFVRTLPDRAQAERELAVNIHLIKQDFYNMAVVFDTEDGEPALQVDGVWYQVQEFCIGKMPNPSRPGMAAKVARTVKELAAHMPEGLIHGDLGLWNMILRQDKSIAVIDFGSLREGDPYFDYATAFGGVINHTSEGKRMDVCREFLSELDADRAKLLSQLRLWAEEGITRWGGVNDKMAARFHHALKWAEENIYEL